MNFETMQKMAKIIKETVKEKKNTASIVDVMDAIGDEAIGNYRWEYPQNCMWWDGMSEEFVGALGLCLAEGKIEPENTDPLVYAIDACYVPNLPLAEKPPKEGYDQLHWLPVILVWKD